MLILPPFCSEADFVGLATGRDSGPPPLRRPRGGAGRRASAVSDKEAGAIPREAGALHRVRPDRCRGARRRRWRPPGGRTPDPPPYRAQSPGPQPRMAGQRRGNGPVGDIEGAERDRHETGERHVEAAAGAVLLGPCEEHRARHIVLAEAARFAAGEHRGLGIQAGLLLVAGLGHRHDTPGRRAGHRASSRAFS